MSLLLISPDDPIAELRCGQERCQLCANALDSFIQASKTGRDDEPRGFSPRPMADAADRHPVRSRDCNWGDSKMIAKLTRAGLLALAVTTSTFSVAQAGSAYDGRWSLSIVTQRGTCDTYNFPVDITNSNVSFPGLVRANGRVQKNGAVFVTVAAGDKSASGSGRLSLGSGSGRWSGHSGNARCSGTWTASRA
jgi:hypothetical protein